MADTGKQTVYTLISAMFKEGAGRAVKVYGISAKRGGDVAAVDDISDDKRLVEELIAKLSAYDAGPDILHELVEDFMAEKYAYRKR